MKPKAINVADNSGTIAEAIGAGNGAKLPDGFRIFDKYKICHTDGTPLKGKRYFVLRLDSEDPTEAARVAAAMAAYKGEAQSCNAAKLREALLEIVRQIEPIVKYMHPNKEERIELTTVFAACEPIYKIANAALAAPARNCDVGTGRIAAGKHDKQNKIEDVIAKMRQFADRHWMHDSCQVVREYADMLEAVVKGGRDSRGEGSPRAKPEAAL